MQTGLLPDSLVESLPFLIPFGIIGIWRWGLYLLRVVFWFCYRPIQPKKNPATGDTDNKYKTSDVTIVVPTIDNGPEFLVSAHVWKKNNPHEVIIVTSKEMEMHIRESCQQVDPHLFRVLTVDKPNKRVQLMKGVHAATTDIIALSDDDAIWTEEFLLWMLAPFDDDKMGGVGSHQEMVPVGSYETVWEVIADCKLYFYRISQYFV
jgi:cellulose synthase/poly-beta-1,6-N-acetylglucosamine synthase-like glycosyltransferase